MIYERYKCPDCPATYDTPESRKQHEYKKKHGRYRGRLDVQTKRGRVKTIAELQIFTTLIKEATRR